MKIEKTTPTIGANISGVDFSKALTPEIYDSLYQALMDNLVIFILDQDIPPSAHLEFAKSFGEVNGKHPLYPHVDGFEQITLLQNDADNPPDTDGWHTDMTFQPEPPFASILIGRKIPLLGGDTLWMSLYAAYDALPETMKVHLEGLHAVHDMGDFRNSFADDACKITEAHQKFGSAIHKVVKTHPITGKKFLYVNESFTQHIIGMRAFESNDLLNMLYRHMNQPEFQVRLQWTKGTLAMWDNRVTQHYATADYLPHFRSMNRITVIKDKRAV